MAAANTTRALLAMGQVDTSAYKSRHLGKVRQSYFSEAGRSRWCSMLFCRPRGKTGSLLSWLSRSLLRWERPTYSMACNVKRIANRTNVCEQSDREGAMMAEGETVVAQLVECHHTGRAPSTL